MDPTFNYFGYNASYLSIRYHSRIFNITGFVEKVKASLFLLV